MLITLYYFPGNEVTSYFSIEPSVCVCIAKTNVSDGLLHKFTFFFVRIERKVLAFASGLLIIHYTSVERVLPLR